MATEHIDLLMPPKGEFGVLRHFTIKLYEAFCRAGIKSRLYQPDRNNPKEFIDEIFKNPPDFTLSFNGLLPDAQGNFLCDMIKIPHIACLVDSPYTFINLVRSPNTIIECRDKTSVEFFKNLQGKNVFFLPHAIEPEIEMPDPMADRPYDITLLGSCIDYEKIRTRWKEQYPEYIRVTLEIAADILFSNLTITFHEALVAAMNETVKPNDLDLAGIDFIALLDEIEMYVRGKDRIDLLKSLQGYSVDLFTNPLQFEDWKRLLGDQGKHIIYHEAVSFDQAIDVMGKSKILLNSTPMVRDGAHERVFAGLAKGAVVLSSPSSYLAETLDASHGLISYDLKNPESFKSQIDRLLNNPSERLKAVKRGRDVVMKYHTWDQRVKELLVQLDKN